MAVFPDRIVLKNSTDNEAAIIAAIETGGTDAITQGEIVLGLSNGAAALFTKDALDAIVAISGGGSTNPGPTPPADPNTGDLWFDINNNLLFVWSGTEWIPIEGGGGGSGGLVFWGGGDFTTGDSDGEAPDGGEFTV